MARPKLVIDPNSLRAARLKAFLSRQALSEKSGVSMKRIQTLESASESVLPDTVKALADALGCAPDDLASVVEVAS